MSKEKSSANTALLVFASLSFLLLLLPLGPVVHAIRVIAAYTFFPIIDKTDSFTDQMRGVPRNIVRLLNTEEENRSLRTEIKDLQIIRSQLEAALEENKRLSQMSVFSAETSWSGVWARIVDRDPMRWYSAITINKGANAGISIRSAVLGLMDGRAGLVGKVIEVYPDTAKVLLISDEMSSVTCTEKSKDWTGLIEGKGTEFLNFNYVPLDAQLAIGTDIVTSPESVVFPAGISVGRVAKIYTKEDFMTFQSMQISPTVKIGRIREVFVISGSKITGAKK